MWSDVFLFPMHKNFFLPFSAGNTKAEPKKKKSFETHLEFVTAFL